MTYNNSGNIGIGKNSYKYPEINGKYNSKVTGKQEKGREEKPRLPGPPNGKGKVMSWIHDVTVGEQDGKLGRNKLVARQCERMRNRLYSFTEQGCRKVVKSYKKVITVITFYCILVTQILKGIT